MSEIQAMRLRHRYRCLFFSFTVNEADLPAHVQVATWEKISQRKLH